MQMYAAKIWVPMNEGCLAFIFDSSYQSLIRRAFSDEAVLSFSAVPVHAMGKFYS